MRKKVKLKDVAKYSKGKQINGNDLVSNGLYDYLNGGKNPSGKWNEYNTIANTVTISEGGNSSGFVNFMDEPFWCGAHCYYLFDLKLLPEYLYYALKSQELKLMSLRTGATMPNIKKSVLGGFEFQVHENREEQKQIIMVLNDLSKMISLKKRQLID